MKFKGRTTDEIIRQNEARIAMFNDLKNPLANLREIVFDTFILASRNSKRLDRLEEASK